MQYGHLNRLSEFAISHFAFVLDCGAQGERSEAYRSGETGRRRDRGLRDLAHGYGAVVWKMFETSYPFLKCVEEFGSYFGK